MPIEGKHNRIQNQEGIERDAYEVTFSNGALDQLRDLAVFFTKEGLLKNGSDDDSEDDLLRTIKISIGISESLKSFSNRKNIENK